MLCARNKSLWRAIAVTVRSCLCIIANRKKVLILSHWTFTSRIAVTAAVFTLSILAGVGGVSYYAMRELTLSKLENTLNHAVDIAARDLHDKLYALAKSANTLARSTLVGNAVVDNEGRNRYLYDFLKDFSQVQGIPVDLAVTDFQGQAYVQSANLLVAPAWIEETVELGVTRSLCLKHDEQDYILIAAPVIFANTGQAEGALVLQVNVLDLLTPMQFRQLFTKEAEFRAVPPLLSLSIHTPDNSHCTVNWGDSARRDAAVNVFLQPEGTLTRWRIGVELRTSSSLFHTPLQKLLYTYLLLGCALMVLVFLVSRALAHSLTQRLRDLKNAASRIAGEESFVKRLPYRGSDEVAQLAQAFNQVLEQLEKSYHEHQRAEAAEAANRAKSAFIANMSHELRTPLNAVLGFAQILLKDSSLSISQINSVRSIQRGGEYLLTLINDILDLAKIEAGRFELLCTPCDMEMFFQAMCEIFKTRAAQKGVEFIYEEVPPLPAVLQCDDKRLRQIAMNLLSNAVKFTEQGRVILRTGYENGELHIKVSDTGIGIAASQFEEIFQPFSQVGNILQKQEGTGLGLSITRKLVEAMNGELRVSSQPGQGSTFHVRIPAQVLSNETRPPHDKPVPIKGYERRVGLGMLRILITDDLADNREILNKMLTPLGFSVREADSGEACLRIAQHWQPDIILMDLRMPRMDGFETVRALRRLPALAQIPVIAVSASAFSGDREQALAAGCNEHLSKPVQLDTLLATLHDFLPLQWLYEPLPAPKEDLPGLSLLQREHLCNLAKRGHIEKLQKILDTLSEDPNCPADVPELKKLASQFRLKEILRFLETPEKDGK
jgi:signal transduction histidine kinase/CheY-like chemotaxis protein